MRRRHHDHSHKPKQGTFLSKIETLDKNKKNVKSTTRHQKRPIPQYAQLDDVFGYALPE